jgi:ABC-type branched-subunit amino acid transport system substrate-binding protein
MRARVLAPRRRAWIGVRTLAVCAAAASMAGAGSCAGGKSGSSTVTVAGTTLTIYASAPAGAPGSADLLAAERLALRGTSQIAKYRIAFVPLTGAKISDNARTAIEDTSSIAYLGELLPGASRDSVGITNGADVLQVSPADTALELTEPTAAIPRAPGVYYEAHGTYGQTFARVVPNTFAEAKAQVAQMHKLGVSKLYVTSDGSQYGRAMALSLRKAAPAAGISAGHGLPSAAGFSGSGADALFDAAAPANAAAARSLFAAVAARDPHAKLFGPSALDSSTFATGLPPGAQVYVSAPGFLPRDLNAEGKQFVSAFSSAYGHQPALGAIFGYEAVKAVLDVLREAGASANDRSLVIKDFFAIHNRSSALGTYSINSSGDTSLAPFVFSRLRGGSLVPFTSIQLQG